ncbi:MAG TPA: hypothetical protein DCP92_17655 [Nitrospiraceae bacterium]|jgi:hypothetical protein|nr:hypothetical protein [Nitrospiraceae bacterium]
MTAEARHKAGENCFWSLVAGPVLGLLYVIALPFITIGTVVATIGKKVLKGAASLADNLVSFGWDL